MTLGLRLRDQRHVVATPSGTYSCHHANYPHHYNCVNGEQRSSGASLSDVTDALESLLRNVAGRNAPEFLGVEVTMSQAKVLHVTMLRPDISMSALAAELKVGPSAMSGLVDRLVEHGYVDRQEDPADRRQQLVSLTPAGRDVVDRIREFSVDHIRPLLVRLSPSELDGLHVGITALDREARASLPPAGIGPPVHERTSP